MRRLFIVTACLLIAGSSLPGCKLKPPKMLDGAIPTDTYADTSVWDEHTAGLPFTYGYEAGMERARAENKPAMVFVTTTWCKWCKQMSAECLRDPSIRSTLEQNFVLVLVDGDVETGAKRKLKASGYPHIAFVSPDEKLLAMQSGFAKPEVFSSVITLAMQTATP